MAENRVQFGLKNVYYAKLTETVASNGTVTYAYATPVAMPGAVTLTLTQNGSSEPFYADNIVFYQSVANNGYEGDLELARVPDSFYTAILGYTQTSTGKVLQENSAAEPANFALLYQIDGDKSNEDYVLYKVTAQRPEVGSSTITDTKTPQTMTMSITAIPRPDGLVFARTTDTTPTATKSGWFSSVYESDSP